MITVRLYLKADGKLFRHVLRVRHDLAMVEACWFLHAQGLTCGVCRFGATMYLMRLGLECWELCDLSGYDNRWC
jgi:hypothetical protein